MRWLLVCVPLRVAALGLGLWVVASTVMSADWMSAAQTYATEWRDKFADVSDPEMARDKYAEVAFRRFDDGHWVFGVCRESRGQHDGGAIVFKDSRGQTHIFLGQGCTAPTLADVMRSARSLDHFIGHESWTILQFKESTFP